MRNEEKCTFHAYEEFQGRKTGFCVLKNTKPGEKWPSRDWHQECDKYKCMIWRNHVMLGAIVEKLGLEIETKEEKPDDLPDYEVLRRNWSRLEEKE